MSRRRLHQALFVIAAVAPFGNAVRAPGPATQDGVTITFLANEGVMLAGGGKKVIIDGLFLKYRPEFAIAADSTQGALQAARAPFDSIDVILVTHRHGDHFHPAPVAAHLRANPRATLLTSSQVIDSLRGRLSSEGTLASRLMARTTAVGMRQREVVNGVSVEILGLRHHTIEHLGYIVDIGGRRVLHVGDTDDAETAFAPFRLDTARIDVALLPEWIVSSERGRRAIERWIRPTQVVAFHVSEGGAERATSAVQASMPGAVTFGRSLETRRW